MTPPTFRHSLLGAFALAVTVPAGLAEVDVRKLPAAAGGADFARDIQPLLEGACVKCHGAEKQKGDFRIDTRAGLLKGGKEDKAIVDGDSARSPLIHYVARLVEDLEMRRRARATRSRRRRWGCCGRGSMQARSSRTRRRWCWWIGATTGLSRHR